MFIFCGNYFFKKFLKLYNYVIYFKKAVSARPYGQRAVFKYSLYTGCVCASSSRWTPGLLTNQNTKKF